MWATLYKREFIIKNNIKFKEEMTLGEDEYFNLKAFMKANFFTIVNEPLYFYNQYTESTTKKLIKIC